MSCVTCEKNDRENLQTKIDAAIEVANTEAKEKGITFYALVYSLNKNSIMWREATSQDIKRLELIGYYTVS